LKGKKMGAQEKNTLNVFRAEARRRKKAFRFLLTSFFHH